jgi:dTDP-4-dehydrorhamnose 3,5-epimerase-like enzyme
LALVEAEKCQSIELPVVADPQGDLAFAEAEGNVPFPIARVFYVYGVPADAVRGGHAHRSLEQAVFCLSGRMEMVVDDGEGRRTFVLDRPRRGVYLPPLVWHDLGGFSPGTVYLALTSAEFDEDDYIRDYDEYLSALRAAA